MVNKSKNISSYSGTPEPRIEGVRRKITEASSPIYPMARVVTLANQGNVIAWTDECIASVQKYGLDCMQLGEYIRDAVLNGRYKDSEWCERYPNSNIVACDAYVLSRKEWIKTINREMTQEFYLKFGINSLDTRILLVSFKQ